MTTYPTQLAALDASVEGLIRRIETSSPRESREQKPAPDRWSLTEIVEHLGLVAGAMRRGARPRTAEDKDGNFDRLRATLRSGAKIRAPIDRIVPRPGVTWEDATARLRTATAEWRETTARPDVDTLVCQHPLAGLLTVSQSLEFLIDHLEHHVGQVEELLASGEA